MEESLELHEVVRSTALESYFQNYFNHLATFACDKAKEYVEKEKQSLLPANFQIALVTLAQNEKMYFSLAFLEQKSWFGRRESLRNGYCSLQATFQQLEFKDDLSGFNSAAKSDEEAVSSLISTVCSQLIDFCDVRMCCIDIYLKMFKSSLSSLDNLCDDIKNLLDLYSEKLSSELIEPLQECMVTELNTLLSLFQSSQAISNWEFVKAVHNIQEVSSTLAKWKPMLAKNQGNSLAFRSGFFGFGEKANPHLTSGLCNWMEKFFNFLVSKFTFYFYEGLSNNTSSEEMKSALSKTSYDFVSKLISFIKKYDAKNFLIVMDSRNMSIGPQHGFSFEDRSMSQCIAGPPEDFTAVLSLSQNVTGFAIQITDVLREKLSDFQHEKFVFSQTSDKKSTYFVVQIEPRLYLVVTFNGQKSEKDARITTYFIEFLQHLKLKRVALLMKPGSK